MKLIPKHQKPSDPLQIYLDSDVHKKYSKDLPSNEADPIGELLVESAFLGKPLELAGKYIFKPIVKYGVNKFKNIIPNNSNKNITQRFLKFVGSDGKPKSKAIPKTQLQQDMYNMLEKNGVDMSKIDIKDIDKALELREKTLFSSGKRFSYQQPVTHNTQLIQDIDNGIEVGYIDLRNPYLINTKNFSDEVWKIYSSNPRNKGLRIGMVENTAKTKKLGKIYNGEQERLTNSAIQVAKQQGYDGVISGESLLSPEKTVNMYKKYKYKKILDYNGKYNWQNHNINLQQQLGPVYLIEQPSYKTIVKSKVFDPKIIDQNGKMKINWKKGASMFSTYSIPITIGEYIYDKNK